MTRIALAALLLPLLAPVGIAQSDATGSSGQDPQAAYKALVGDYQNAVTEHRQKMIEQAKKAAEAGNSGRSRAISMAPDAKPFIDRAQALALQFAGDDGAVPFHGFVLQYAGRDQEAIKKALLTLTMDHSESAAIGSVMPLVARAMRAAPKECNELFAEVVEFNPSDDCKAMALTARGEYALQSARSEDARQEAIKDLERVATLTKDAAILAQAEGALFEVRHLQVGCEAPEIVANDVDGVEFKLSDYKGKVILLDFWGFW